MARGRPFGLHPRILVRCYNLYSTLVHFSNFKVSLNLLQTQDDASKCLVSVRPKTLLSRLDECEVRAKPRAEKCDD